MKGRSRFRFRYRGIMGALAQSLSNLFDKILADEETAGNANVFYDPQDLTSLRVGTDGSGGQPVVGDPVGMMLDTSPTGSQTMAEFLESQPELVTNGTFDTDASGWTGISATLSSSSGELVVTSTVAGTCWAQQDIAVTSGSSYLVSVDHKISGISQDLFLGSSTGVADLHNGPTQGSDTTEVVLVTATSSVLSITLRVFSSSIGQTGGLDNVTVKELPGHHAIAPSDAARPILYDEFDTSLASLTDDGTRGEELVDGSPGIVGTGWTDNGDGSYSANATSFNGVYWTALPLEVGSEYVVEFTVDSITSGSIGVFLGTNGNGFDSLGSISVAGVFSQTHRFIRSTDLTLTIRANPDFVGTISGVSIRKVNTAFDERGDELVTNGTFDTDLSSWNELGSSGLITWSSGSAVWASGGRFLTQYNPPLETGKFYEVTINIEVTSGQLRVGTGALDPGTYLSSTGTHTFLKTPQGALAQYGIYMDGVSGTFVGQVNSISIKEILTPNLLLTSAGDDDSTFDTDTGNWGKDAGISIGSGVATFNTAGAGDLYYAGLITLDKWYKVTFYVSRYVSGTIRLNANRDSNGLVPTVSSPAVGWYTFYGRAIATLFKIGPSGASDYDIDNIIVQEVPASVPRSYYLDTDGVDDWMQVTPTLDLGEQWWHTGGWRSDASGGKRPFATSNSYQGAPRDISADWVWYDPSSVAQIICTSTPATKHVLTIEQSDTNSLSARYNGATEADPITPYDDSGSTQGVALFTQQNNLYANGWNGRFYGGAWGQGQVDYDELTTLQDYLGTLLEPDIDPTDVTAYANVYDMLGAQTAAALFDINDKTSLRVGRDGSGGVPAEGDPVGVMMDVSGTGGLTMEAYLSGATELGSTTAGDWTLFSGGSGTQAVSNEGDVLVVTGGAAVNIGAYLPFGTTVGKIYKLEASVELGTATALDLSVTLPASGASIPTVEGGSTYEYVSGAETVSWYFVSTAATLQLKLTPRGDGLTGKLTSLTIKELPGYTAVAASDAARPTLKTYNSPISSRDVLTTTYSWTITDGGRA